MLESLGQEGLEPVRAQQPGGLLGSEGA